MLVRGDHLQGSLVRYAPGPNLGPLRAPFVLSLKPFTLPFYLTFPTWPAVEDSGYLDPRDDEESG